jgi:hypothetical protein
MGGAAQQKIIIAQTGQRGGRDCGARRARSNICGTLLCMSGNMALMAVKTIINQGREKSRFGSRLPRAFGFSDEAISAAGLFRSVMRRLAMMTGYARHVGSMC